MPGSHLSWPQRWLMAGLVYGLVWGLRLLYSTLRSITSSNILSSARGRGARPFFLAFWHGRMLYFLHRYHRQRFTMLVSRSKDGEFVGQVLQRFGVHVTRGSSHRGGAQGHEGHRADKSTVGIMQALLPMDHADHAILSSQASWR